jgi:hypothetical protein
MTVKELLQLPKEEYTKALKNGEVISERYWMSQEEFDKLTSDEKEKENQRSQHLHDEFMASNPKVLDPNIPLNFISFPVAERT